MFGVIGEDRSDVDCIKVIIRRVAKQPKISVKTKGYNGCGEMLRKGATQLSMFRDLGMTRFVVCYDADRECPTKRFEEARTKIVIPSKVEDTCIVVPVQEIEAWILADLPAVSKIISSWKPQQLKNPESINDPKEHLERMSRAANKRPRYSHAMHNPLVVEHLDLDAVYRLCPSFRTLHDFIKS